MNSAALKTTHSEETFLTISELLQAKDAFLSIPGLLKVLNKDDQVASREFIYRMAKSGTIPTYRINRKIFVRLPEVLDALRSNGSNGQPQEHAR